MNETDRSPAEDPEERTRPPPEPSASAAGSPDRRREEDPGSGWWDGALDRMTIGQRLGLAIALAAVLLVAGAVLVSMQVGELEDRHDQENREREESRETLALEKSFSSVVEASQAYVMTGSAENRSRAESRITSFETRLDEYEVPRGPGERSTAFSNFEENATAYIQLVRRAQGHVESDEMEEAQRMLTGPRATQHLNDAQAAIATLSEQQRGDIEEQRAATAAAFATLNQGLFIGSLAALVSIVVVAFAVASGTRFRLASIVTTLSSAADDLSETLDEQETHTEEQTHRIEEATRQLEEIQAVLTQAEEHAAEAAGSTLKLVEWAEEGQEHLESALVAVDDTDSGVTEIAEQVLALSDDVEQIEGLVDDVAGIADQINMLALNSSVEASRVGEEAQGLDEIRTLADQTQNKTKRLSDIVNQAQESIDTAAIAIERGSKGIGEARSSTHEGVVALETIQEGAHHGAEHCEQMLEQASEHLSVQELSQRAEAIKDRSHGLEATMGQARQTARDLRELAQRIERMR